jgi:signal transduction histidine kinase
MASGRRIIKDVGSAELPVRLHDASTCVALAIGFLRENETNESMRGRTANRPAALLEDALTTLRGINARLANGFPARRSALGDELAEHATRLGIRLSLRILGSLDWLSPAHSELIRLTGREALMNTSRHSGTRACEITLDASRCPYHLNARDWGAGISGEARDGGGLVRLRRLAVWLGSELTVASRSGLGMEILLRGPTGPVLAPPNISRLGEETSS